jgi:hypothetical protein
VQRALHPTTNKKEKHPMTDTTHTDPHRIPYPTRFPLGQVVATPGALEACPPDHLNRCLYRHARGDWGATCPADKQRNDQALNEGGRLLSAYPIDPAKPCKGWGNNCLWIITEADRSVTTFLLPEEY